ncbi:MAG: tRNA (adenosine(37)-N6)-threonylcarbamoyltransferase complex dimerization subunit type 1 TsaB [Corynebacterium sp.]|nr:tRNA (adenosine(37)-N6)-threonylcarbamoyltransferase complex dimerization subunit type 1 TsaB [Corynebacterium sp.]
MLILAIDSSTPSLVAGLVRVEEKQYTLVKDGSKQNCADHNEQLVPTIQELLAAAGHSFADVDAVALGQGPGPFTGLRVGMATAIAIADALQVPVYPVCSLDAIAHHMVRENPQLSTFTVTTDARRREVYTASYENLGGATVTAATTATTIRTVQPASVIKPEELELPTPDASGLAHINIPENPARLREVIAGRAAEAGMTLEITDLSPDPLGLVASIEDFDATDLPVVPLYLRRPDAVIPAAMKKATGGQA